MCAIEVENLDYTLRSLSLSKWLVEMACRNEPYLYGEITAVKNDKPKSTNGCVFMDTNWYKISKLMTHDYILFYDGDCPFCNRMILWLIKRDKKEVLRYAPLDSALFRSMVPKEDYDKLIEMDTLVFIEKGHVYYYSTAALKALKITKSWWIFTFKMSFIPRSIRDYFYRKIARNRKRIYSSCRPIPLSKRHLFLLA